VAENKPSSSYSELAARGMISNSVTLHWAKSKWRWFSLLAISLTICI